ncbi:sensor domain-containing diguanylate cyclase [Bacillus methanolicus]|uniref:sensor domain-containing diguanylate cyclase n=1 Tax=Bacillus methanolicus TaxID=1471 RepID=UPI002010BD7F|nr:sensor domain-containing diguanylate cyclase [Bacillus methanolicus]
MIKPRVKLAIWLCWFLIVPPGMWLTYHYDPPQISGFHIDILAFFLLISVVAAMPIVINNTPIFLIQWLSLTVFLLFGLFIEMLLFQIAVIVLLVKLRIPKEQLFRFPLNSILFFIVSFCSASIYYTLGGAHHVDFIHNPDAIWPAFMYGISSYAVNQIVLAFILWIVYGRKSSFYDKDFVWETATTLTTFPLGLILYVLYQEVGLLTLLYVGIPFISLSIILKLYYSSDKINQYLQKATEIGNQLAAQLQVNEVVDLFIEKLTGMLPVDYAYILDVVEGKELHLLRSYEKGTIRPVDMRPIKKNDGICGFVLSTGKSALFNSKKEWKKFKTGYIPETVESVLSVPIVRNNQIIGVLFLASNHKRAFEKPQLMIVEILCSHFAVALENAKNYEKTKEYSEKCPITKIYNYRYFENILFEEFNMLEQNKRQRLSLLILDIDHFKKINDTYGHHSGNEILRELAARLTNLIGNKGTVARYGGEEFVILLPDMKKVDALELAEIVRQTIANCPFTLLQTFDHEGKRHMINITASIGAAAAPEDADDPLALIRHADRALYGAKRAGRNQVAEYEK